VYVEQAESVQWCVIGTIQSGAMASVQSSACRSVFQYILGNIQRSTLDCLGSSLLNMARCIVSSIHNPMCTIVIQSMFRSIRLQSDIHQIYPGSQIHIPLRYAVYTIYDHLSQWCSTTMLNMNAACKRTLLSFCGGMSCCEFVTSTSEVDLSICNVYKWLSNSFALCWWYSVFLS